MDKGRITLGRGCVHGHPFSHFCVERAEGGWGEEGVVVRMASSKWRWASCLIWGRTVDVTMVTSFLLSWWKEVKMVVACLLGKEVEATIVNPLPSKTRQLVLLWNMAGLPWGRGVHGHPFSHFCAEKAEGWW